MKEEIVEFIIKELMRRIEEIKRLEIKDRLVYIGFLIEEISGIPAIYLPKKEAGEIIKRIDNKIKLSDNDFG
jgi:hypothetical protein